MDLSIDTLMCLRNHVLYVSSIVQNGFIHGHDMMNKCTPFAGHFDSHGNGLMRF